MKTLTVIAFFALSLFSMAARATVIDFNDQVAESKGPVYEVQGVTFLNSGGQDLFVVDQGGGDNALAVLDDDANYLAVFFPTVNNSLSIDFGNDSAARTASGDVAVLTLFLNGDGVAQTTVLLNRNGLLDQTISLSGFDFDAATFGYFDSTGAPINLTELVDNITYTSTVTPPGPIPEPASIALLGLGMLAAALARRRKLLR